YHRYQKLGLKVLAMFSGTQEEVKRFVLSRPRPFQVVADPSPRPYETYGIEYSFWGKLKGIVTRLPTALKGLKIVGLAGLKTSNRLPADFIIDKHGQVIEAWYGRYAGDRIPLDHVDLYIARSFARFQVDSIEVFKVGPLV